MPYNEGCTVCSAYDSATNVETVVSSFANTGLRTVKRPGELAYLQIDMSIPKSKLAKDGSARPPCTF